MSNVMVYIKACILEQAVTIIAVAERGMERLCRNNQ
jgi:hypothetical protein